MGLPKTKIESFEHSSPSPNVTGGSSPASALTVLFPDGQIVNVYSQLGVTVASNVITFVSGLNTPKTYTALNDEEAAKFVGLINDAIDSGINSLNLSSTSTTLPITADLTLSTTSSAEPGGVLINAINAASTSKFFRPTGTIKFVSGGISYAVEATYLSGILMVLETPQLGSGFGACSVVYTDERGSVTFTDTFTYS